MDEDNVELTKHGNKRCLKFNFGNNISSNSAENMIVSWTNYFSEYPNDKFVLIWDCLATSEYEPSARIKWQKAMKELSNQIDVVWIISNKKMIIFGAKIMNMLIKLDLRVVTSINEIPVSD